MLILGMNFSHDGSVAAVLDGRLVCAISSERITRVKKQKGITHEVISYVLNSAGATLKDVHAVALADYMQEHSHDTLQVWDSLGHPVLKTNYTLYHNDVRVLQGSLMGHEVPVYVLPHQLAHCASAYYTSNWDQADCLSVDSSFGSLADNSMIAQGEGSKLWAKSCPGLISGIGYAVFTELLGFEPAYAKAGTTMGLSAYGTPLPSVLNQIPELFWQETQNTELDYRIYWSDQWSTLSNKHPHELSFTQSADLAASAQYLLEHSILKTVQVMRGNSTCDHLCLSGGSLLNCPTNTRIKQAGGYAHMHHLPACGDDGNAVGAALYVAHHVCDLPRHSYAPQDLSYLGRPYDHTHVDLDQVSQDLSQGKIVGWCMGASEFGPRALGNRSILADPRSYHMRERINFAVKHREWFRPVAPVVMAEHASEWFDHSGESAHMLYTSQVRRPELVPAITHVDHTARHQTVTRAQNPQLYDLIHEFYKKTGVPMLVNTSLNGSNEPIIETPEQAKHMFDSCDSLDQMVIQGHMFKR
jgi:carbamoyltransferase